MRKCISKSFLASTLDIQFHVISTLLLPYPTTPTNINNITTTFTIILIIILITTTTTTTSIHMPYFNPSLPNGKRSSPVFKHSSKNNKGGEGYKPAHLKAQIV